MIRTDAALINLHELAERNAVFTLSDYDKLKLLLETANMTPCNPVYFTSNIYYYDAVNSAAKEERFPHFEGLRFPLPYYPLIDSSSDVMLGMGNFTFKTDPTHLIPDLKMEPFKPLLEDLFADSRLKAINAGYEGISEFKIYLYDCIRDNGAASAGTVAQAAVVGTTTSTSRSEPASGSSSQRPSPHYTFRAGKCDYFTGVARKDLFSRFLVPSVGNLRQPLLYLLEHGTLYEFVPYSQARTAQRRYREMADQGDPPNVRLGRLFADDPELEESLMALLHHKVDEAYTTIVNVSHTLDENGDIRIFDTGATYTGCGTFVLTGDRDAEGRDRPFLLLEKRWRVSEENDNLSYPSGGSCDLYIPDGIPQKEENEHLRELEASPFATAVRELREELNLICHPEDLQLVSFGIDVNRNLQQFSFLLESSQRAQHILDRKHFAATPREGFTFFLPFERQVICDILNNYQMESGAIYSLMRLLELKSHRLWPQGSTA
jgi:8-oxo-dGTP pyrophosphatase MutT (NUDIX family)